MAISALSLEGRQIDLRVSCCPTVYGESVVLRILDKSSLILDIQELGMAEEDRSKFDEVIRRPHGIFLVTGPTGSGKTTTLYTALIQIFSPSLKIITVEDPVEYHLPGVCQIQVNQKRGLTFATGLRSIMRQDPDVIMVGEIRDGETAEISIRSALTGHLVFSTLHTNTAAGAIPRLLDMGIDPFLISSSLNGILAQRLVRRICRGCRIEYEPSAEEKLVSRWQHADSTKCYRGAAVKFAEEPDTKAGSASTKSSSSMMTCAK
jgi:type II secretion system protein E (GspE)